MADITIRRAGMADAVALARVMRPADADEVFAAVGLSPLAGAMTSLSASQEAYAGLVDGNIAVLFGVAEQAPWLLGSDLVASVPISFLRRNRAVVEHWNQTYGRLENHVDARNVTSIKWLEWLGFTLEPAEPWGFERRAFHRFWKE